MALTPSTMLALGTPAPDFNLPDADGALHSRDAIAGRNGLLVAFWCQHCPYVQHIRERFSAIARELQAKEIGVATINSNDLENFPQDGPDAMREEKRRFEYTFPYLIDESQEIAKAYHAACTPDWYLFGSDLNLFYRGQFDASRPGNAEPVTGKDLTAAVEAMLAGEAMPEDQKPSSGCNIKWKPGQAPRYT